LAIQDIEHPAQPIATRPELARQISGQTFTLTGGAGDLFQAVTLTFTDGNTYRSETLWPGDQAVVVTGGLDNIYRLNPVEFIGLQGAQSAEKWTVAVKGHWQDDRTFVEHYVRDLSSDIAVITQRYTFQGQRVTIDVTSSMNSFTLHAQGEMTK
jgi:hypothetical protein